GFGTLYRARHCSLPRVAAIKVLRYDLSHDPTMLVRFEREARALASLRHPNVVDIYDLGDLPDGRPYIVMQWIDGCNLHEHIDRHGPLTLDRALAALAALGSALSAAHDAGVIHRDVKAANVIGVQCGDLGTLKLVDFGIAKLQQATQTDGLVTSVGVRIGTPETMAPEQILGREVDERVDVYALGLLFFQLLTGRLPFERSDAIDLEELHLHGVRPNISALAPVPKALDLVVRTALAVDPNARYGTVGELVRAAHCAAGATAPEQGPGVSIASRLN
ncbi:MAG TPA: serine/threonine-protein kinase, partial [Kofleriaceae bacterium]|nr:serine/threonine-protein kinase [Kofleriaceae bacterium]